MKKIFFSLLLAVCTAGSMLAGTPTGPVVLRQTKPRPTPTLHRPIPLSETPEAFSVFNADEALIVTSEIVTDFVTIYVEDENSMVVFSTAANMAPSSEVTIPTKNLQAGNYTLYIEYSAVQLEGEFELE